jgi:hypothetical protein
MVSNWVIVGARLNSQFRFGPFNPPTLPRPGTGRYQATIDSLTASVAALESRLRTSTAPGLAASVGGMDRPAWSRVRLEPGCRARSRYLASTGGYGGTGNGGDCAAASLGAMAAARNRMSTLSSGSVCTYTTPE